MLNANLQSTIHAVPFKGDRYYVADCLEVPVVAQGLTVDETFRTSTKLSPYTSATKTFRTSDLSATQPYLLHWNWHL